MPSLLMNLSDLISQAVFVIANFLLYKVLESHGMQLGSCVLSAYGSYECCRIKSRF